MKKSIGYCKESYWGLLVITIGFILLAIWKKECSLFDYNLMDVITAVVVSGGIYLLSKKNDDNRKKHEKIEHLISLITVKLHETFDKPVSVVNKAEYLYTFKYFDNKIEVLEKLTEHLDCEEQLRNIRIQKDKLDDFIMENLEEGEEYFKKESVKDKIPNILCNLENYLDKIVLKIYE